MIRPRAIALALVCLCAVASACAQHRRVLGEECVKDGDCQSGRCAGRICAAEPDTFDPASPPPEPESATVTEDGGAAGDGAPRD